LILHLLILLGITWAQFCEKNKNRGVFTCPPLFCQEKSRESYTLKQVNPLLCLKGKGTYPPSRYQNLLLWIPALPEEGGEDGEKRS